MIKTYRFNDISKKEIFARAEIKTDVEGIVSDIIADVRERGDRALIDYAKKFDKADLTCLEVSRAEIKAAAESAPAELMSVLRHAKENIENFHRHQVRNSFIVNDTPGVVMGQKVIPIEKVGLYVPGGTAAYPSSVLMNCIPAKLAGVSQIIMVTPPTGGGINQNILAAAYVAGVDRIFMTGGAQAVAALAYGTESVPKVDKIVGPGNAFVAEAKKQVFGTVAIDMIAGPSEILVIADGSCNPKYVAADLLSQAEHDKNASAVLVTDSEELAKNVADELEIQLKTLPREEIARTSIDNNGKIIIADSITQAVEVANEIAPEHLEICVDNPFDYLGLVKNAGSVFMGKNCPEALGDYMAGPNHTLPTSGSARFSSPLSVDDFVKKTQYTYFTDSAFEAIAADVAYFAHSEGLDAHARSATVRTEGKGAVQ